MANLIWGGDGETGMTDMRAVFDALPGVQRGHDWLVSDAECWRDLGLGGDPVWLTGAELEIVCVDSSFCLLIGLSDELAAQFRTAFPEEVDDLDEENRRRLST